MSDEDRLRAIVRDSPLLWRALTEARSFALPDWWVVSGAVYNTVWNALTGRPDGHGIKDIDLFYFDPDTSWDAEDRAIRRGAAHFAPAPPVEIRNQARVHLWYQSHFGRSIAPILSCRASIADFACETHAVGIRLGDHDQIEIEAPFGLDAIFALRMVPNPRHPNRATHEAKGARCKALWPELVVEPWPEITVVRAHAHQDWEALLGLLHRAFAYMEDRIDPHSSLHRLDAASLTRKTADEICFLAHDGHAITGCVFCKPQDGALYVGKLAVDPAHHRKGIAAALMARAQQEAEHRALPALILETRVELIENHQTFARLGFEKIAETAHPGYDRPTSITMRKVL